MRRIRREGEICDMSAGKVTLAVFLVLALCLSGCGRTLDPETLALIEASDAVCRVGAKLWSYSYQGDMAILECRVKEDYLGNISTRGRDLNSYDRVTVYVMVDEDWYDSVRKEYYGYDLILFLDLWEEEYQGGRWDLFVPHGGEESIRREGRDAAGVRYMEALRAYGKKHPREAESWTFPYPEGIWTYFPPFSSD